MSRAQASLPSGYLSLRNAGHSAQNGIFARKTIPKSCRFGPAEGLEQRLNSIEDIIDDDELNLVIINEDGSLVRLGTFAYLFNFNN